MIRLNFVKILCLFHHYNSYLNGAYPDFPKTYLIIIAITYKQTMTQEIQCDVDLGDTHHNFILMGNQFKKIMTE
jgi:hypothetical protein